MDHELKDWHNLFHMVDPKDFQDPELILEGDFESIQLTVHIQNLVTQEKWVESCQIIELGNRGMTLSLPPQCCRKGNNLLIDVFKGVPASTRGVSPIFRSTAKVNQADELEDGSISARVTFVQYDEKGWQDLQAIFSQRQDAIFNFFMSAGDKGG